MRDDLRQWNLQVETCQNRSEWSKRLKTASHTQTRWALYREAIQLNFFVNAQKGKYSLF